MSNAGLELSKKGIGERQKALPNTPWFHILGPVVKQYNNEAHTTTGEPPKELKKLDWDKDLETIKEVRVTIAGKAHFKRNYPEIRVGDQVKLTRKPGAFS